MASMRVLFLGITGVEKRQVMQRLSQWYQGIGQEWHSFDFERDYLFNIRRGGIRSNSFLNLDFAGQAERWKNAWKKFATDLEALAPNTNIFLSLHGCYIRGFYGSRCVLSPRTIAQDFRPTLITTLINDIYDTWWRTEQRAHSEAWRGRPTLEQLLFGRRQEIMVGDQIASECGNVKNLMIATSHPCETLAHCITHSEPQIVYLSFPISEPRRMEAKGDASGMAEINSFLKKAYQFQQIQPTLVLECPLGIDEMPLRNMLPAPPLLSQGNIISFPRLSEKLLERSDAVSAHLWELIPFEMREQLTSERGSTEWSMKRKYTVIETLNALVQATCIFEASAFADIALKEQIRAYIEERPYGLRLMELNTLLLEAAYPDDISLKTIYFRRDELRWNMEAFWPPGDRLAPPAGDSQDPFPVNQLRDAYGSILTDVSIRDYRLVDQADCLAVFNPVFNGRATLSGSVEQEIAHAINRDKPVYVFQDPKHDPHGVFERYMKTESTMVPAPPVELIVLKDTVEKLLQAVMS